MKIEKNSKYGNLAVAAALAVQGIATDAVRHGRNYIDDYFGPEYELSEVSRIHKDTHENIRKVTERYYEFSPADGPCEKMRAAYSGEFYICAIPSTGAIFETYDGLLRGAMDLMQIRISSYSKELDFGPTNNFTDDEMKQCTTITGEKIVLQPKGVKVVKSKEKPEGEYRQIEYDSNPPYYRYERLDYPGLASCNCNLRYNYSVNGWGSDPSSSPYPIDETTCGYREGVYDGKVVTPVTTINATTWKKISKVLRVGEWMSYLFVAGGISFMVIRRLQKKEKAKKEAMNFEKKKDVVRIDPKNYRVNVDKSALEQVKRFIFDLNESDPDRAVRFTAVAHLMSQGYDKDIWKPYAEDHWCEMLCKLGKNDQLQLMDELKFAGLEVQQVCEQTEMKEFAAMVK